jgi:N-acetylneuraminic acid mutarotase
LGLAALCLAAPALAERVKIYTGVPGSDQFHWGNAPAAGPADDWSAFGTMPLALMDNMVCTDGKYIYVPGGYTGTGTTDFNRYDPLRNTWTALASLPIAITSTGAAVIGDTLYIAGGYENMSTAMDTLLKYSISGDTWTTAPGNHSGNNWLPKLVAHKGRLFFFGGCQAPGATAPSQQLWTYTPGAGWSLGDSLNYGRVFTQAVVYHDTVWVAGGATTDSGINYTEFYDPTTGQWIVNPAVFPPMPTGIWGGANAVAQGRFAIFSGVQPDWNLHGYCQYFNFATRAWETPEAISAPRYRTDGCGFLGRAAFCLGGSSGGFTPTNSVQYKNLGPSPDAAVLSIVDPKFPTYPVDYMVPATVRVANLGDAPASFPVRVHVAFMGGWTYDQTVNVDLGAFHDTTFNYTTSGIGSVGYNFEFEYTAGLAGDADPSNDTLIRFVSVSAWQAAPQNVPYGVVGYGAGYGIAPSGHPTIYVAGGTTGAAIDSCIGYDLTDNVWVNYAHMPVASRYPGSVTCNGKLYFMGAWSAGTNNYIYDMAANSWTTGAAVPIGTQSPSAAAYKGSHIYLLGGGNSWTPQNYVQVYDIAANTWSQATPLPAPRIGGAAACIGDRYLVYSGGCTTTGNGRSNTWLGEIDPYDPTVITWREASPNPTGGNYRVGYATLDDVLFIAGGFDSAATVYQTTTLVYNPEHDAWLSLAAKITGMSNIACPVGPYGVYVPGGYQSGSYLNTFEIYSMMPHQTGVEGSPTQKPLAPKLALGVKPNPFKERATISFQIPATGQAELAVYNMAGQRVRTLLSGRLLAGEHGFVWDGRDGSGKKVSSGTYLVNLKSGDQKVSKRLVLVK